MPFIRRLAVTTKVLMIASVVERDDGGFLVDAFEIHRTETAMVKLLTIPAVSQARLHTRGTYELHQEPGQVRRLTVCTHVNHRILRYGLCPRQGDRAWKRGGDGQQH